MPPPGSSPTGDASLKLTYNSCAWPSSCAIHTSNPAHRRIKDDTSQAVIHAWGNSWGYHGPLRRGNAEVNFRPSPQTLAARAAAAQDLQSPDVRTVEIRMAQYAVPTDYTTVRRVCCAVLSWSCVS